MTLTFLFYRRPIMARKQSAPSREPADNGALEFPFGANTGASRPTDLESDALSAAAPSSPDPFDPASLRLSQDFPSAVGVKKVLLSVPVRKPHNSWFVRVHPSSEYRLQTAVIELKEDRETYLVAPNLWPELATETTFKPKLLVTAVNRQGLVFLWEVNLPRQDGRVDEWTRTAHEAVHLAMTRWVRITANMALGAYEVSEANGQLAGPEWPDMPFQALLRIAFKERYIDNLDHPVLRRLRGEV
jgi:hypothetical protein